MFNRYGTDGTTYRKQTKLQCFKFQHQVSTVVNFTFFFFFAMPSALKTRVVPTLFSFHKTNAHDSALSFENSLIQMCDYNDKKRKKKQNLPENWTMNLTGRERNGVFDFKSALHFNTAFGHTLSPLSEPLLTQITVIHFS